MNSKPRYTFIISNFNTLNYFHWWSDGVDGSSANDNSEGDKLCSVCPLHSEVGGRTKGNKSARGGIMMMAFGCVAPVVDNGNFNQPDGLEWLLAHCVCRRRGRRGRSGSWVVDVVVAVVVLVEGSE